MGNPRFLPPFLHLPLIILLIQSTIASKLGPFRRMNIVDRQWEAVSPQFRIYNGFWVRYDSSASPTATTLAIRNFTYLKSSVVIQTNLYSNPNFFPIGSPLRDTTTFLYFERDYDNPLNRTRGEYFYPANWGLTVTRSLDSVTFGAEKFLIFKTLRISFVPIYVAGLLQQLTIIRERKYPGGVTAEEALKGDAVKIKRGLVILRGVWARLHECIDKNYDYTVAYALFVDFRVYLPKDGENRFAYSFPWGMRLSMPKSTTQRPFVMKVMWHISYDRVVTGRTKFGRNGLFEKDCSSVFYKLGM